MKILQKTLLTLVAGSLLSVSAQAAVGNGQPYVGVKVGQFLVDADGFDDATAYGVYGGYNFDSNFGVEVEYLGSSDADVRVRGVDLEYDVKTYGIYGTYRYAFPNTALYAKGKLGIAKNEINASVLGINISEDDTGIAAGLGLGYLVNPDFDMEAEYAVIDSDINLLTVGAKFKF
jgi:hypothetical protein